jgi:hypothetical protein
MATRKPSNNPRSVQEQEDQRQARISEAAYYHAERRGFGDGEELDDWLRAEKEIDGRSAEKGQKGEAAPLRHHLRDR